jgi:hypothetical protein
LKNDSIPWYCADCAANCGQCKKLVKNTCKGLLCDQCQIWYHNHCVDIDDDRYSELCDTSFDWICQQCEVITFSDSFFNSGSSQDESSEAESEEIPPRHQNNRKKLKTLVINFQSMKKKTADIESLISMYDPDLIQGTETWLTPAIGSAEIIPEAYTTYRKDRPDGHGGVLFAHKKDLIVTHRQEFDTTCEILWNQIEIKGRRSLLIGTYYKPRHDDSDSIAALQTTIDKINSTGKMTDIIICGDVNQPNIDWKTNQVIRNHWASTSVAEDLLHIIEENGLQQVVKEPTRGENILDIVLTNNVSCVGTDVILESAAIT